MRKGENMEVEASSNKLNSLLVIVFEKISREYDLTMEEVKSSTITIKDGEITVKTKGTK